MFSLQKFLNVNFDKTKYWLHAADLQKINVKHVYTWLSSFVWSNDINNKQTNKQTNKKVLKKAT